MKALLTSIWLQSNPVETSHQMNEQITEIESHYLIPAFFILLVLAAVAGIVFTKQKHKHQD